MSITTPSSILFGAEKSGRIHFIDSVKEHLTDNLQLLTGDRKKHIKLKKHIDGFVSAFKKPQDRAKLPDGINGLWKADLFVGNNLTDNWVGTTVKINPSQLESARGLRLGIVPCKQGRNDKIEIYGNFLEGFNIVKQFILAHGQMPSEMNLPSSLDRLVCKELVSRRKFPILGVIEVLKGMGQPHLMSVEDGETTIESDNNGDLKINRIVTPVSLMNK